MRYIKLGKFATAIPHFKGALAIEAIHPVDRIYSSDVLADAYLLHIAQLSLALVQGLESLRFIEAAFAAGNHFFWG